MFVGLGSSLITTVTEKGTRQQGTTNFPSHPVSNCHDLQLSSHPKFSKTIRKCEDALVRVLRALLWSCPSTTRPDPPSYDFIGFGAQQVPNAVTTRGGAANTEEH